MALYYVRKTIALLLLAAPAAMLGYLTFDAARDSSWGLVVLISPLLTANLLALAGLAQGKAWGRWLALAGAISGLCLLGLVGLSAELGWTGLTYGAYFGGLLFCLLGPRMARRHERHPRSGAPLTCGGWRAGSLGWGATLSLAALPLLWISLFTTPLSFLSTSPALLGTVVMVLIVAGVLALVMGRTAGVLLLLAAGVLLVCLWFFTGLHAFHVFPSHGLCNYHIGTDLLVFQTVTTGLILTGAALLLAATAGPMWRFLRR